MFDASSDYGFFFFFFFVRLWQFPGTKYSKLPSIEEAENDSANAVGVPPSSAHANAGLPNAVQGNKTRYGGHGRAIFCLSLGLAMALVLLTVCKWAL